MQRIRTPLFSALSLSIPLLLVCVNSAHAQDWKEIVGYTQLQDELGPDLPTGVDFGSVSMVEAPNASSNYRPNTGNSQFASKTFSFPNGGSTGSSSHATTVAQNIFGLTSSVVPSITEMTVYETNAWIGSGGLNSGSSSSAPNVENSRVQNHSWIGSTGNTTNDQQIIRRFDYMISRDNVVAVVGVNNGSASTNQNLMSTAYNALSVGTSDGNFSATATTIDGAGRQRPHLVAPADFTSYATARVSSAAAFLLSTVDGAGASLQAADDHRVIKSLLMAGATKETAMNWSNTETAPLDAKWGAGQLNVYNSYHILDAGRFTPSDTSDIGSMGWDINDVSFSDGQYYYFDSSQLFDLTVSLNWDREVEAGPGNNWNNPTSFLANLTLALYEAEDFSIGSLVSQSISSIENFQYLYLEGLTAGRYALEIASLDADLTTYGLSWMLTPVPEPSTLAWLIAIALGLLILRRKTIIRR